MPESRQVRRARERANDYWRPGRLSCLVPSEERSCRRPSAPPHTRVIHGSKAAAPRVRRPYVAKHPNGMKHAWQRKKAFWDAVRARTAA